MILYILFFKGRTDVISLTSERRQEKKIHGPVVIGLLTPCSTFITMCGPKSCTKKLAGQLSTLPKGGTCDISETFRGVRWVLHLAMFKISALCGHQGFYTRPEAEADITDVIAGHGGPLHLHLGFHGDKVHVSGGASSGLDIAPSTLAQEPVV